MLILLSLPEGDAQRSKPRVKLGELGDELRVANGELVPEADITGDFRWQVDSLHDGHLGLGDGHDVAKVLGLSRETSGNLVDFPLGLLHRRFPVILLWKANKQIFENRVI